MTYLEHIPFRLIMVRGTNTVPCRVVWAFIMRRSCRTIGFDI